MIITDEEQIEIEERAAIQTEHLEGIRADIEYRRLIAVEVRDREDRVKAAMAKIFSPKPKEFI